MTSVSLVPTEHNNQRILTTPQLAEFYGTDEDHIHDNYRKNKDRYIEGKHFYRLEGDELRQFKSDYPEIFRSVNRAPVFYLWTEKGALQHAKSLNTDEAWTMYEKLVDDYYQRGDELADLRQRLERLEQQQPAQTILLQPIFSSAREAFYAKPQCACPTQEQVEAAIIATVQMLQPSRPRGVTGASLIKYNQQIQAYMTTYGVHAFLELADSLVERQMLTRTEDDYYSVPVVSGYLN